MTAGKTEQAMEIAAPHPEIKRDLNYKVMAREIEQKDFFRYFERITAARKIPFDASFELTYNCNLHCCHCYIPRDNKQEVGGRKSEELSYSEVCSILDQLADMGCFHLELTGGEVFTRPDILQILDYAKKKGFYVIVLTNGTLITPYLADQLKDLRINQVDISVYGMVQKTYEATTKVSGSFLKCLQGIKLLLKRDIPICLKMTVTTLNADEFGKVKAFAKDIGVGFQWGYFIFPKIDGSKEPLAFRISPQEAINLEVKNQTSLFQEESAFRKTRNSSNNDNFFHCNAGKNSLGITAYGQIVLCLQYRFPRYDLRRGTLKDGWQELVNYVESLRPATNYQCVYCELREFCQCCPADGWLNESDRNACVPYFRELAAIRSKRMRYGNKSIR
jgi:MoaA/NifB/PqqE/SkfB family radical SAM enzyme